MRWSVTALLSVCLVVCFSRRAEAQDAVFSQFFNTTLYLNPALAGIEDDFTVNMNYRSQWKTLQFPYTTSQVSLIMPYYSSKHAKPFGHWGGTGLSVYNDISGENKSFKTTGANASAAYNLPLDHNFVNQITFGLQIGLINKRVDTNNLQWGEQYNPFVGFDSSIAPSEVGNFQNRTFVDINSGIFWWYNPIDHEGRLIKSINSGLSVAHMNNPNESVLASRQSRLPLLYKYHGGVVFNISRNATVSANLLVAFQNNTSQENIGSYLSYKINGLPGNNMKETILRLGAWARVNDSFIFLTEMETRVFKFAYSYDLNSSSLRYNSRSIGTSEIHLGLKFTQHAQPKSRY